MRLWLNVVCHHTALFCLMPVPESAAGARLQSMWRDTDCNPSAWIVLLLRQPSLGATVDGAVHCSQALPKQCSSAHSSATTSHLKNLVGSRVGGSLSLTIIQYAITRNNFSGLRTYVAALENKTWENEVIREWLGQDEYWSRPICTKR